MVAANNQMLVVDPEVSFAGVKHADFILNTITKLQENKHSSLRK